MKKKMKKVMALALAASLKLGMTTAALAQTVGTAAADTATITITNAAKGETYKIFKLFDASVTGDEDGSIAYTGEIPASLSAYFTEDTAGNIFLKEGKTLDATMQADLKAWALTQTPTAEGLSDGSVMDFVGLDYGYYIVISSQSEETEGQGGAAITVDSTNPNVTIVDKNSSEPTAPTKTVDDDDVFIGQTVEYTVEFGTSNYDGAGVAAERIISYTITDTLPSFLSNVEVTSVFVDETEVDADTTKEGIQVPQFDNNKIVIDWYDDEEKQFLYDNGATVKITYTAVVTDEANIDGAGNTNTVTMNWETEDGDKPDGGSDNATIYTYAIALKKVDDKGVNLDGAVFTLPFYVKADKDTDGAYIYAGTEAKEGLVNQLTTPENGEITIKGVAQGEYTITEFKAPDGYNLLTEPVKVSAVKTGETTTNTTFYIDENGNKTETQTSTSVTYNNGKLAATAILVINKTGIELPSTGGIGTTIFYVLGSLLVAFSGVVLFAKKRMRGEF